MIVLDTHVLIWWVTKAPGLSTRAKRKIQETRGVGVLVVSTMSVFESATAARRGRLSFGVRLDQWLDAVLKLPELRFEPVSAEIARLAGALDDSFPGDPADRIIAATAISLDAKLVTADARLRGLPQLQTVW